MGPELPFLAILAKGRIQRTFFHIRSLRFFIASMLPNLQIFMFESFNTNKSQNGAVRKINRSYIRLEHELTSITLSAGSTKFRGGK
jgi:hypothetical protein